MKVEKKISDLPNGLGPDSFYYKRIGTDLPAMMFPTDLNGNIRNMVSLEEIRERFKEEIDGKSEG